MVEPESFSSVSMQISQGIVGGGRTCNSQASLKSLEGARFMKLSRRWQRALRIAVPRSSYKQLPNPKRVPVGKRSLTKHGHK